jgi:hypothetical protein
MVPASLGRGALLQRPVEAIRGTALAMHQRVPPTPERPHLQFILAGRLLTRHATRDVGPRQLALRCEASLAAFQAGDIIRGAEAGWPEERDKVLEALLAPSARGRRGGGG